MPKDDDPDFSLKDALRENTDVSRGKKQGKDGVDREHLIQRTMHALSVSEKFTEFLCQKLDQTRTLLLPAKSEGKDNEEGPVIGRKRQADDESPQSENQNDKKMKLEDGVAKATQNTYINRQGLTVCKRQPKLLEGAIMRDYQLDGLDWLMVLDVNGANGILADEMGLGKTLQVIALLCFLIEVNAGEEGPFLVIGPLSTLHNWMSEFKKFAPKLPVILYHGNKNVRERLRKDFRKRHVVDGHSTYPIVVTSYEMPLKDLQLRKPLWRYLIIDEGHRLKNHECLLIKELRKYRTVSRLLLTGTPLQNNLTELWSLLNFILPDVINDMYVFESWFDSSALESTEEEDKEKIVAAEEKDQVLSTLHRILKPFLLRRVKADVALAIPPKKELLVYAPMTVIQRRLYEFVVNRSLESQETETDDGKRKRKLWDDVASAASSIQLPSEGLSLRPRRKTSFSTEVENSPRGRRRVKEMPAEPKPEISDWSDPEQNKFRESLFEGLTESNEECVSEMKMTNPVALLRKICNHPYLSSYPAIPGTHQLIVDERIVQRSGKLMVLDALLQRLKKKGHKVLLFSNFTQTLDLLEDYLALRDYSCARLDGSRDLENRQENIEAFSTDSDCFVFLISTRAGGLGINLIAADTVIIYDSDWNPQVDLQAQDRCHRIGQTRPVAVYRLIAEGTIDETIFQRAEAKRQLDKLVIQHGKFKSIQKQEIVNLEELRHLLYSKDHHKVTQSNGCVYTDDELDSLCDRKALFPDWFLADSNGNKMKEEETTN